MQQQVTRLEQEVKQWQTIAAHLAAVLRRVRQYARRACLTAHLVVRQGNVAPQYFHFMRGVQQVSGKVVKLTNG
jgi:hypothetical protein